MRPANRLLLPSDPSKSSRFPRTDRRAARIAHVLARRQPDLAVVLENVHDAHNIGAVLRSCDAVGVLSVHTIYTVEERPQAPYARSTSGSASKWIEAVQHESVEACYDALRAAGNRIAVADLSEQSVDVYDVSFVEPIALVFGNEHRGASAEAIQLADLTIAIPMMGMVESLNISVACAVTLFEALRQRRLAGRYDEPALPADQLDGLMDDWLKR